MGGYLAQAFSAADADVRIVDALDSKAHKLWPVLRSIRCTRKSHWRARWENTLYSSWAWRRNSRRNVRLLARINNPAARLLQVGKEYFPHAPDGNANYDLFILYTMKLSLADGVTPWLPPPRDQSSFLDLETRLYRNARYVFTGGAYVKDHLAADYGVRPECIHAVGGGAHPDYVRNAVEEVATLWSHQMVFVGWDFGMKGGPDLLTAFRLARAERPELRLVVVGPDAAQQVDEPGVTWLGSVRARRELIRIYRESDLFVMPSLRDSFGFVFLEAMTQGVPCIGTDLNAMPEIIQDGVTGYIVPPRDPEGLAAAILRFYKDPENRYRMGMASRQHVLDSYTWSSVAQRMWPYVFGR